MKMAEIRGINLEMAAWKSIDHQLALYGVDIGGPEERRVGAVMRQAKGSWNWQIFYTKLEGVAANQEQAQLDFDSALAKLVGEAEKDDKADSPTDETIETKKESSNVRKHKKKNRKNDRHEKVN